MRAAVIGVGSMGRHHARVYDEIDGVELVAVADNDPPNLAKAARRHKVVGYLGYREMLRGERLDLVSVAVPTRFHHQVALDVIERGVHLLVEKPIAPTVREAQDIILQAKEKGLTLAIGHIERFNPAVAELKRRLERGELGKVFLAHARRLGPFPERIQDMGVVLDLATHDLDVMCYLLESDVVRVYAETTRRIRTEYEDLLSGLLRFANGAIGVLDINYLTPTKIRELSLTGERGMFLVNYLTQDLYFYKNDYADSTWESLGTFRGVSEGAMTRIRVKREEPLRLELESFAHAVTTGGQPLVSGEDGLRTLCLARKLIISGEQHV